MIQKMKSFKLAIFTITFAFAVFFSFVFGGFVVHAEDVNIMISYSPTEVKVGDTVNATVSINGDSLANYNIYLVYTTGILQNKLDEEESGSIPISGTGPNTFNFKFKVVGEGKASIATDGTEMYDSDGYLLSIAHAGANLVVGDTETDEDSIKIGKETYTLANEYVHIAEPEGFDLTSINYKDRDIYAYQPPNHKLKIVCLQNEEWEQKWFVYDEKTQTFSPFIEYNLEGVTYVVMNKPEDVKVPAGFEEANLTLDKIQLTAYKDNSDSGLYLVYAMNQAGYMGFYFYDVEESSFTRYSAVKALVDAATASDATQSGKEQVTEKNVVTENVTKTATPLIADDEDSSNNDEDDGLLSRDTYRNLLSMMIVLFVVMCVVVIILVVRNGYLQNQLYGDDDYYDEDDDYPSETTEDAKPEKRGDGFEEVKTAPEKPKISRNKGYAINEDTGEILLEEAMDNNAGVNVPPAEDKKTSKIEMAMESKPFGIDSAFDVADPENAPEGENVYVEREKDKVNIDDEHIKDSRENVKKKVEQVEAEKAEAERKEAERRIVEKATREKLAAEKAAKEKANSQKANAQKASSQDANSQGTNAQKAGSQEANSQNSNIKNNNSDNTNIMDASDDDASGKNKKNNKRKRKYKKHYKNNKNQDNSENKNNVSASENTAGKNKESKKVVLPGQGNKEEE